MVCLELKEGKRTNDEYARITHELSSAISADNGLLPAVITIVAPKTIPKTTSGKISRSRVRNEFENRTLNVVYEWKSRSSEECLKGEYKEESKEAAGMNALEIEESEEKGKESKKEEGKEKVKEEKVKESKEEKVKESKESKESMNMLSTISEKSNEEDFEATLPSQMDGIDTVDDARESEP